MSNLTSRELQDRISALSAAEAATKAKIEAELAKEISDWPFVVQLSRQGNKIARDLKAARAQLEKALAKEAAKAAKEAEKAQAKAEREAAKEAAKAEREAQKAQAKAEREAERKVQKRAKALDRCSRLHLAALNGKNASEKLVADRITDQQIEAALDACAECKDSGRIAFARLMFAVAYSRQREVFSKIGILEAEGLIAVAAKYERILVKAGFNTLTLREELNHAA